MTSKILVIEDNPDMADNIVSILELAGFEVLSAGNGKAGVHLAQQSHPDLILCDVMMPELDGFGVLQILSNNPATADIPFVFLTARSDKDDFRKGMNLGADDYLVKPFDGHDLLNIIDVRLRKADLLKNSFRHELEHLQEFFERTRAHKEFDKLSGNRLRAYKKKEFVFMEDQAPNDLFYVVKGEVKSYKVTATGKELITGIHHPGDFIGYASLLDEKPYIESAITMEDSLLALIPKEDFIQLLYSDKEVAHQFIKLLSNNLAEAEERLLDLAYRSVRQRVARALLKISTQHNGNTEKVVTISRQDISNIVGTATESLNRTLADFRDEGLIDISGEGIRLTEKHKLEHIVE